MSESYGLGGGNAVSGSALRAATPKGEGLIKESPINDALMLLQRNIEELEHLISRHSEAIGAVLMPESPTKPADNRGSIFSPVLIADVILRQNSRVVEMTQTLRDLTSRVSL